MIGEPPFALVDTPVSGYTLTLDRCLGFAQLRIVGAGWTFRLCSRRFSTGLCTETVDNFVPPRRLSCARLDSCASGEMGLARRLTGQNMQSNFSAFLAVRSLVPLALR